MIAYIFLILAALADIYTSHRIFKNGGHELNKFVTSIFGKRPALFEMFLVKAAMSAVVVYFGGETGAYMAAAVWGVVAALNWRKL